MSAASPDPRAIRIAENESRFRELNDRVRSDLEGFVDEGEAVDFVCECGSTSCHDRLALTFAQYEAVRTDSRRFAVVPGHQFPDVEEVVADHGAYLIVEKGPSTAPIVERGDPRRGG